MERNIPVQGEPFGTRFLQDLTPTNFGCGCGDYPIYHKPFEEGGGDASVSGTDYIHGWTEYR